MKFKRTGNYLIEYPCGKTYTLSDILHAEMDGNPCNDSMGRLEELQSQVDNQERIIIHLIELLSKDNKIKIAKSLGYELLQGKEE
jgi:hypothetical protein